MATAGIQISSVRKYLQTPQGVLDTFKKVSDIGYRYIQVQWVAPEVPYEFIRDALLQTNLTCLGTQDYTHVVLPQLDNFIRMNKLWNCANVCISGIPKEYLSAEGCRSFAVSLMPIMRKLEDNGLFLSFHPRAEEYADIGGRTCVDLLLDLLPAPFQLVLDLYHIQKAGLSPADWIRKTAGRSDIVHFKDGMGLSSPNAILTPTGQGELPWADIAAACQQSGTKYCLAEQESWANDPFDCLRESYDFITSLGIAR